MKLLAEHDPAQTQITSFTNEVTTLAKENENLFKMIK
jgi:hypothetical protein